jgi:peptidyl-prolyl cis-trans isomerase D
MLLGIMRKHAKSWLIKVLIAIIAIVFVFYFGYSFTSDRTVKVASVNGEIITGMEYRKAYRELREALFRQYRDVWSDNLVEMFDLKNRALESLIMEKLISIEARKLGLDATEGEIQQAVMRYPAFQTDGRFDIGRYRALLAQNRMEPEDFEAGIARELLGSKLRQFVLGFVPATEAEARDYFKYRNEKIRISYVKFDPDQYIESVEPSESEMESYFQGHKEDYRIPEKIRLTYISIDPGDFASEVHLSERTIENYYEYHLDAFVEPEEVRARHILFKVPSSAEDKEVEPIRKKAESVLKQARDGADFSALAVEHSEGPTGSKGGDLGYFTRGDMEKAFEDAAFSLEKGEISDIVRTRFGFHIIKIEDTKPRREKTLSEVREEIEADLRLIEATELAREKGLSLIDQMPYEVDLAEYASHHGLPSNETSLFAKDEPIPGIAGSEKLRESLFSLPAGEVSDLMEVEGKYYLFQIKEREKSRLPSLQEVADDVKQDVTRQLAAEKAESAASTFLKEVSEGGNWNGPAAEQGLEIVQTDFFSRIDPVEDIDRRVEFNEIVFSLNTDRRFPEKAFQDTAGVFIFRWEEIKPFDEEAFEKEKNRYTFQAMTMKHRAVFDGWLESLRQRADVRILTPLDET